MFYVTGCEVHRKDTQTPESMTDAIADSSSSLSSPNGGEIAEGGGEAPASALDAAAVAAPLVRLRSVCKKYHGLGSIQCLYAACEESLYLSVLLPSLGHPLHMTHTNNLDLLNPSFSVCAAKVIEN